MPVGGDPTSGSRTRSISESEADRISSAVLLLDPCLSSEIQNQSPILGRSLTLELSRSNPNISPPGSGLIDTPIGVGLGTRLQTRNNPRLLLQQEKAEKICKDLIKDVEIWIVAMKSPPPPELLTIVDGYECFKRHIQRASEEAILRRLSTQFTFQLSDLLVKLQALKKKAERRDRQELNNLRTRSSTTTNDSEDEDDNVFRQVHTPPPSQG